jgi:hypothetical protein
MYQSYRLVGIEDNPILNRDDMLIGHVVKSSEHISVLNFLLGGVIIALAPN